MPMLMVIAAFALLGVADAIEPVGPRGWPAGLAVAFTIPVMGGIALRLIAARVARGLDRRGDARGVSGFRRAGSLYRVLSIFSYAAAVLWAGWPSHVRDVMGDLPALDELVIALPVWVTFTACFASSHPIDRRMHEAVLIRRLDEGLPVQPHPSLVRAVLLAWRHQVLFLAIPLTFITAWSETVVLAGPAIGLPDLAVGGVQIAGTIGVLALSPLSLRYVWDAVPIRSGELHDDIALMCRSHRVRISAVLVWRTGGTVVNAAVAGLLPFVRYMVLSDALLEQMPRRAVEGVAAHEIAHVKHHHLAWLALTVMACVTALGTPLGWLTGVAVLSGIDAATASVAAGVVTLAAALGALGYVSRRFEWQADAFAASHLSRTGAEPDVRHMSAPAITEMCQTLGLVAELNGLPPERFMWRHGSISERQRRVASLQGAPLARLRPDREARTVKVMILVVLGVGLALVAAEALLGMALRAAI
ncbi:MAG: M48 family metalloprotease [Planctomycetota bacterium]